MEPLPSLPGFLKDGTVVDVDVGHCDGVVEVDSGGFP
jgi:hypothetical protein